MDLADPAAAVLGIVDGAVLRVLAAAAGPLSGREVQSASGRSPSAVRAALARMVAHGLVQADDAEGARLYVLNREHVAADAVVALFELRERLFDRIRSHLRAWPRPAVAASVIGAAALGEGGPDTVIELFVVRPGDVADTDSLWAASVEDLIESVRLWSGNRAEVVQATPAEVAQMLRAGGPMAAQLRNTSVRLTGTRGTDREG